MGLFASQHSDARGCLVAGGADDPAATQARQRPDRYHLCLIACLLGPAPGLADTYRIATYAAPLSRDGPGLLLRDILRDEDAQIAAITAVIDEIAPDVLVLSDFDYDLSGAALAAFANRFAGRYPHRFARQPNAGLSTGLDLDRNGYLGDARDAQGYGRFAGDGGLAILSRYPIDTDAVIDHSTLLWRDLPGAVLPQTEAGPYWDAAVLSQLRLSSTGHWIVPIALPDGPPVTVLAYGATPPVFDGPEDRNGLRNRDELRLWQAVLDGAFGPAPQDFVIAGNANLDPIAGQGFRDAMADFLADPCLQDPLPGRATANWAEDGPGQLRVSYVLPSAAWQVTGAGVFWPAPDDPKAGLLGSDGLAAGVHHLVWVDIAR